MGAAIGIPFCLAASWLRGEGTSSNGTSTATGDSIGIYTGEVTLDLHKRGPIHPVVGMGVGFLHVSRQDAVMIMVEDGYDAHYHAGTDPRRNETGERAGHCGAADGC